MLRITCNSSGLVADDTEFVSPSSSDAFSASVSRRKVTKLPLPGLREMILRFSNRSSASLIVFRATPSSVAKFRSAGKRESAGYCSDKIRAYSVEATVPTVLDTDLSANNSEPVSFFWIFKFSYFASVPQMFDRLAFQCTQSANLFEYPK